MTTPTARETQELVKLLREARKIIHCHSRDLHKDWLQRSSDALWRIEKHG